MPATYNNLILLPMGILIVPGRDESLPWGKNHGINLSLENPSTKKNEIVDEIIPTMFARLGPSSCYCRSSEAVFDFEKKTIVIPDVTEHGVVARLIEDYTPGDGPVVREVVFQ